MANNPELLKMPLARDGQKSTIPETTDASTGLFSQQYGWQSINSLPPQAGGKAVKREDFNGAFNLLGGISFMVQKGFTFKWSAEQDYYAGCVVIDDTDGLRYECIADVTANSTAPSADATHWQIFKAGTDIDAWFRQTSTVYAVGDMRCYESLPYGWYLDCTTAGTTGGGDITIPSPLTEKDTVTDGTVVWTIRKIGSGGDGVPLGAIIAYSANGELPSGYLLCDGSAVSRTMFPDLFSAIGTTYGAGDGSTTFNLPNYSDGKFPEGSTVAGTVKQPGLPNIEGTFGANARATGVTTGALSRAIVGTGVEGTNTSSNAYTFTFDASISNPIYGNSTTVQPYSLTCRYIIKAYDGVTPTPAEADISEMLTELTGKANINGSNLTHHKDVITTSGTYTVPATGLYKITVKGGGGGGAGGSGTSNSAGSGGGGGEGGTTIAYIKMLTGESVTVVIGAGGAGGAIAAKGTNGGDSSVVVNGTSYIAGGGGGGGNDLLKYDGGVGGTGTITGVPGCNGVHATAGLSNGGAPGGGAGGGAGAGNANNVPGADGSNGGGGQGGSGTNASNCSAGGAGGDGYVWFEYYTP